MLMVFIRNVVDQIELAIYIIGSSSYIITIYSNLTYFLVFTAIAIKLIHSTVNPITSSDISPTGISAGFRILLGTAFRYSLAIEYCDLVVFIT